MINLGFIGVGGYGETHLRGFLPHHHAGRVRIRALADASPMALAAAEKLTGLPSAAVHLDYQELLDRDDLHAVVISTPISSHRKIALHAIEKGLFVLL
jgi:predicted dehydrogenase